MNPSIRKLLLQSGPFVLSATLILLFAGFGRGAARPQPSPVFSFDARILLKQFESAQRQEMAGLIRHERAAAKHLQATQTAEQKQFDRQEKDARRKFFVDDHPGSEKRAYMKDLISRREALHQQMADAREQAKSQSDDRIRALRDEEQVKHKKFQDELRDNQRPDDSLWPQPTLETD